MATVIPFRPSEAYYSFDSVIGGVTFTFDVHWNSREEAWYFDVSEQSDIIRGLYPIVQGVKVVLGTYLGRSASHPLFKRGVFLCRAPNKNDINEPRFDDMGTRIQVLYFSQFEMSQEIMSTV